ncbi:MAG: YkgJ family cysteine cluster protein [bacterium]|nr:YkgJ family cysteine cluster protein [bacterium]
MEPDVTPISMQETFCFSCHPEVPCFNECCRDLNQFLTPYDILRLKNHLGLSSGKFLEQYTFQHIGPDSGLPIITLKPGDQMDLICPFVTPAGCSVYEDRPSSCRTYPLMRGVSRSRESGMMVEQFMVLKEQHCCGFDKGTARTVRQWIDEQGIAVYNEINDKLLQIISLKNIQKPGALNIKSRHMFFTALYDPDNFKSQIINNALLEDMPLDPSQVDKAFEDDLALLEVGMKWVERVLFEQI